MYNAQSHDILNYSPESPTLKRIFELYVEETITDEQVERVLAPVRRMIKEGKFDKPSRVLWTAQSRALTASVAALVVVVAIAQANTNDRSFVDIFENSPPLTAASPADNMPVAYVTLTITGTNGMNLTLVNTDSMRIYGPKVANDDGICVFEEMPEGTYRIIMSPDSSTLDSIDAGTWLVADGKAERVSGGDYENLREGVDVQVCLTE